MLNYLEKMLMIVGLFMIAGCGQPETDGDATTENGTSVANKSDTDATDGNEVVGSGSDIESSGRPDGIDEGFEEEIQDQYPEQTPVPVEAISVEDFNASWQTDLNIENQPAGDVLAKLAGEIGLMFEKPENDGEALDKNVSVSLEKGTRLQAIEDVCRQIGMTPLYVPRALRLEQSPRQLPVVFAGPFLIQVSELEEVAPYATGRLTLRVYSAGLPATVGAAFNNADGNGVTLTAVVDSDGEGHVDGDLGGGAYARAAGAILDTSTEALLKSLLKHVEKISVSGKIQFALPTKVSVAKFEKLEVGATAKAGDVEFTIKEIDLGQESIVSVNFSGVDLSKVQLVGYDADHKTINGYHNGSSGFNMESNIGSDLIGQPESLEIRITEKASDVAYEFAIQDIPLSKFAEMPEQIEPLKFAGDTPVTFEFIKFETENDQETMIFKVTNHTDKSIQGMNTKLEYLDADGKTIQDMPYMKGGGTDPVVDAGKTIELTINSFMLEGTKSARMTIENLRCFDATSWKRE